MKTYQSFGAMARAFERISLEMDAGFAVAMEKSAVLVETAAKAEIGHYQREDMGPFSPWPELQESTKRAHAFAIADGRAAPDAGINTPELVTGKMREDIGHVSTPEGFEVGGDEILKFQELGTSRIPPRPVLGPALYRSTPAILAIVGEMTESTLAGEKP